MSQWSRFPLNIVYGPTITAGKLYYCDGVSGNDANDGLSPNRAFKTIVYSISIMSAGDNLVVKATTYDEAVALNKNGIYVQFEPGTILNNSTPGTVVTVSADYVTMVGGNTIQAGQIGVGISGGYATVYHTKSTSSSYGFNITGEYSTLIDCAAYSFTAGGFRYASVNQFYARDCVCSTASVHGFRTVTSKGVFDGCCTVNMTLAPSCYSWYIESTSLVDLLNCAGHYPMYVSTNSSIVLNNFQCMQPIDTITKVGIDITSEYEITTTPLSMSFPSSFSVIVDSECNTTTAGCILTIRVVFNDGANNYEVYNSDITVSAGVSMVSKTSKPFSTLGTGTVRVYITSDDAADISVDASAKLIHTP